MAEEQEAAAALVFLLLLLLLQCFLLLLLFRVYRQLLEGYSSAQRREIIDKWRFAGEDLGFRV